MMVTCCGELFFESSQPVESAGLNPTCNPGPVCKGTYALILGPLVEVAWWARLLPVFLQKPVLCSQHSSEQRAGCCCCLCPLHLEYSIDLQLLSFLLFPCPSLQSTDPSYSSIHVGLQYTKPELMFFLPLQSMEVLYRRISLISSLVFMCLLVCTVWRLFLWMGGMFSVWFYWTEKISCLYN